MIEKYNTVKKDVFEYIHNRLQADIEPTAIVAEIQMKFPTFVAFFKCDPEMLNEFMTWLVEQGYFYINRRWYGEEICADRYTGASPQDGS